MAPATCTLSLAAAIVAYRCGTLRDGATFFSICWSNISEPEKGTPSTVMQVVKQRFARRVLRECRRRKGASQPSLWEDRELARVWQARFYDFNVWGQHKRVQKLRYMHNNPVKRGLVLEPGQWAWSSFRDYELDVQGPVKLNQWPKAELKRIA